VVGVAKRDRRDRQRRPYRSVLPEELQVPQDQGCEVNPVPRGCLHCPLDKCLWDYPYPERIKVKKAFLESKQR
jgi:hypothetical protein